MAEQTVVEQEKDASLDDFSPEVRWLVHPEWVKVVRMMDSMDHKEGTRESRYPHLEFVEWHTYHMPIQALGYPYPADEEGSFSDYQRQLIASVEWVSRLGQEIDPKLITAFPAHKSAQTSRGSSDFINEHDPEFADAVRKTSKLLEIADQSGYSLGFGLTEENYKKLESQKEKIAAFLLLRSRVSSVVGMAVGELFHGLDGTQGVDLQTLYQEQKEGDSLRDSFKTFLDSPIGERKTLDWLQEMYNHPLFTSTTEANTQGRNHKREEFIQRVETSLHSQSNTP